MTKPIVSVLLACSLLCPGQTIFDKAPPDIDNALRARVGQFYQAHVDRRLRLADAVVAEDSKDAFFEMEKTAYLNWEIGAINYSDNFTKAKVIVGCEMIWASPRLGKIQIKRPLVSLWKMVDGQWFWYIESTKTWETPFGTMAQGPDNPNGPVQLGFKGVKIEDVLSQVQIDRTELRLSSYEASQGEATITNKLMGNITLRVDYTGFPGLEVKLDKTELKSNEQAKLLVSVQPRDRSPKPFVVVNVHVEPTKQVLPLKLSFSLPPELEKLLPGSKQ